MKKKSFITYSLVTMLIAGNIAFLPTSTTAEELESLKQKKQEIKEERETVNKNIEVNNEQIDEIVSQQNELTAQIKKLDKEILKTEEEIKSVNIGIEKSNDTISKLKKEIEVLKEKLKKRAELLEERARSFQTNGGFENYMEVIFNAENFGDLINRFTAVGAIVQADRDIITDQKREQESLEKKEQAVREELAKLEAQKEKLDQLVASFSTQKEEKDSLINSLASKQTELEEHQQELDQKSSELYELEQGIEQNIIAEQERLVELAREKELERKELERKELERKAAAENKKEVSSSSKPQQASSNNTSNPTVTQSVSEGTWTAPAYGRITTEFGYDILNGQSRYHYGIDIAAGSGTSIVAAAEGFVINASYSSSYGNWIVITHSINGQTFTTVYAHMNSLAVSQGQYVEKGQYLGGMGNTGYSFGNHLHFELHEGNWNNAKSNAVNPRKYISF